MNDILQAPDAGRVRQSAAKSLWIFIKPHLEEMWLGSYFCQGASSYVSIGLREIYATLCKGRTMDPVSYLFAAYLKSVQNEVYVSIAENMGTEVAAVVVDYEGTRIPFQHQLWTVRPKSVCAHNSNNLREHSACTIKAGKMFNDICQSLTGKPGRDIKYVKARNMYCNAAVSFKPVVAKISASGEKSDVSLARTACNAATIAAMGSGDPKSVNARDAACGSYQALKNAGGN